ncbi:MAG: VWA domain-containing protein [Synergistaceae bacterium]|jgi:Ca-activated chloride channel family protein|nr:VWA domain-containing protein [Synergistaceae bacterium]
MSRNKKFLAAMAFVIALFFSLGSGRPASASLLLEVDADTPMIEADSGGRVVVRALVRPAPEDALEHRTRNRAPLAVALVIDRSGSMGADRKMENAKRGAIEALGFLTERDIATIVVYDSKASTLVSPRAVSAKAKDGVFAQAISRISPQGSTALYDGVEQGARELRPFVREGYTPRILLLSDGMANVGPSSTRELAALGRALSEREMTITTIGLGLDYNEDLMTAIAAESGGNSYFARTPESLPGIFARDMEDAVDLTARRVSVTLVCDGKVTPVRAIGRSGEQKGKSLSASIDNVYGAEKYALFEIEIPPQADKASMTAAAVKVEYVDAVTGEKLSVEAPLKLSFTKETSIVEKNRNAEVIAQTAIARNAEILEEVVRLADEGRAEEASLLLRERASGLKTISDFAPQAAPALQAEAEAMDELASEMESEGSMSNEQRKDNVNKAYMQKNQQSGHDE